MNEIKQEELVKNLNDLKKIIEFPQLYLANYFAELRNEVSTEINTKKAKLKDGDEEKKQKLNEIWRKLIEKLDILEKQFINNKITDRKKTKLSI